MSRPTRLRTTSRAFDLDERRQRCQASATLGKKYAGRQAEAPLNPIEPIPPATTVEIWSDLRSVVPIFAVIRSASLVPPVW
jgi:hypothetical protein